MSETFSYDNLIAGCAPIVTDIVTIDNGADLVRGTVLGKISASGKYVICDSDGTDDGRRTPIAILAEDAAAASDEVNATIYLCGEFNESACTFSTGDTADTHRNALRDCGIYLKSTITNQ